VNWNLLRTSALLTIACLCIGCGGSEHPTVSGKVTYDGEPLANIQLVFNPVSDTTAANAPYSTAVTDENGAFSLKTRDGQLGAAKSYTVRNLKQSLTDSKGDPELEAKFKEKIAAAEQKLASRPTLKANLQTEFTVPTGGSDSVNFELTDF